MNSKRITLINPNVVVQAGDILGSGVPYLPLGLAYAAANLRSRWDVQVIDSFGENPFRVQRKGGVYRRGSAFRKF